MKQIMKTAFSIIFLMFSGTVSAAAFSSSFTSGTSAWTLKRDSSSKSSLTMEYIPSGMSKEQWKKIKENEKTKTGGKNLGKVGITTFKSRTFADWQKSGGINLFPVDPTKIKDPKQIPYMQRPGGSADDADLKKKASPLSNMFGKKKATTEEPVSSKPKSTNWWTLS